MVDAFLVSRAQCADGDRCPPKRLTLSSSGQGESFPRALESVVAYQCRSPLFRAVSRIRVHCSAVSLRLSGDVSARIRLRGNVE